MPHGGKKFNPDADEQHNHNSWIWLADIKTNSKWQYMTQMHLNNNLRNIQWTAKYIVLIRKNGFARGVVISLKRITDYNENTYCVTYTDPYKTFTGDILKEHATPFPPGNPIQVYGYDSYEFNLSRSPQVKQGTKSMCQEVSSKEANADKNVRKDTKSILQKESSEEAGGDPVQPNGEESALGHSSPPPEVIEES